MPEEVQRKTLSEVFETLEENDLIARMDFLCCDTCAQLELTKLLEEVKRKKGYVFFHEQNTDRLLDIENKKKLHLGFGTYDDMDKNDLVEIAETIVSVFKDSGYETEWDDDPNTKVVVYIKEEDIRDMKPIWRESRRNDFS